LNEIKGSWKGPVFGEKLPELPNPRAKTVRVKKPIKNQV